MYNELQAAILCGNTPLLLKILFTESTSAFLSYRKRKKPSLVQSSVIQNT